MPTNGLQVTLQPPDGDQFTLEAGFTLATGDNGGHLYSGFNGFWIEVVDDPDDTHRVADFGWPDGQRQHTITRVVPIIIS